jgi:hypothetical protein
MFKQSPTLALLATAAMLLTLGGCELHATVESAPAGAASAPVRTAELRVPMGVAVAGVSSQIKLIRTYDAATGIVCYSHDDFKSSPSCLVATAEMRAVLEREKR